MAHSYVVEHIHNVNYLSRIRCVRHRRDNQSFVAVPEKLPQYIKTRDELKSKESEALASGHEVLVEQFGRQAEQLDKIITNLQEIA